MVVTVEKILSILNEMAPPDLQEDYDNVGLLVGDPQARVPRVLVALDATLGAVEQAKDLGANLLITHHPVMFRGRKDMRTDDPEAQIIARLIKEDISLIAAHTNYDNAPLGVNDALAKVLGLTQVQPLDNGLRISELSPASGIEAFEQRVGEQLRTVVRSFKPEHGRPVTKVALCGGAGSEFWPIALAAGADVFITGEVRHHDALAAVQCGLTLLEAGHWHTEQPAVKQLAIGLQNRANELNYKIVIFDSATCPFA